jgi:hypothetical protein
LLRDVTIAAPGDLAGERAERTVALQHRVDVDLVLDQVLARGHDRQSGVIDL